MSVFKKVDQLRKGGQDTYRCQSDRNLLEPLWLSKKMVSTLESKKRFVNHSLLVANFEFFKMGSFRVVFSSNVCMCPRI